MGRYGFNITGALCIVFPLSTLQFLYTYIGGDFVNIRHGNSSEFIVGFPLNYNKNISVELTLYVTTTEVGPVPFVVETLLGFMYTGTATNNSTTMVRLDSSYQVRESNETNKGIRIHAGNKQISVHGLNYKTGTSDAFLALPCAGHSLNEYV